MRQNQDKLWIKGHGRAFRLNCEVDIYYEYCLFRHNKDICNFAWTMDVWNITIADCEDYKDRMEWSGDYEKFQCAITIKNAKLEDSGTWSCEIESYPNGQYRGEGYGFNVTAKMEIQIVPRIVSVSDTDTETDTGKETEPGNNTLISKDIIKNITYHKIECKIVYT